MLHGQQLIVRLCAGCCRRLNTNRNRNSATAESDLPCLQVEAHARLTVQEIFEEEGEEAFREVETAVLQVLFVYCGQMALDTLPLDLMHTCCRLVAAAALHATLSIQHRERHTQHHLRMLVVCYCCH